MAQIAFLQETGEFEMAEEVYKYKCGQPLLATTKELNVLHP
jgi:hypothetical protein